MLNALTVDVEDYFQVSAFEKQIDRADWDKYPTRVVANTRKVLELLERHDTKATFFILGWIAERFPRLVQEIHSGGHEIGSHSYWHRLVYNLSPDKFRADLSRSRDILEQITGEEVVSFRAPSFSITDRSLWALDVLIEEGFTRDSSVFPILHDRYGIPGAETCIHSIERDAGSIVEFPPSVLDAGMFRIPVSGGGYFRLFPYAVTSRALRMVNQKSQPFIFYIHPWELDPKQPRLNAGTRTDRLRHYVNLGSVEDKLNRFLRDFTFGRMDHVRSTPLSV